MQKRQTWIAGLAAAALAGAAVLPAAAQTPDAAAKFVQVASSYRLTPNVTYLRAGGVDEVVMPRLSPSERVQFDNALAADA